MSRLRDIQFDFQRHVLAGHAAIAGHIVSTDSLAGDRRLEVYSNAYRARLIEALGTDYEVLNACVGDEGFDIMCRAYIDAHPSTYYNLRWFGQHFPAFLRSQYAENLGELAEFEWALASAFDAADAAVSDEEVIKTIVTEDWPGLRIRLHPSVDWLPLQWNTLALWKAVKNDLAIPAPERIAEQVDCLIWRDGLATRFRSLEPGEKIALDTIASGATFADLCERLAKSSDAEEDVVALTARFMRTWLTSGLVSELVPGTGVS